MHSRPYLYSDKLITPHSSVVAIVHCTHPSGIDEQGVLMVETMIKTVDNHLIHQISAFYFDANNEIQTKKIEITENVKAVANTEMHPEVQKLYQALNIQRACMIVKILNENHTLSQKNITAGQIQSSIATQRAKLNITTTTPSLCSLCFFAPADVADEKTVTRLKFWTLVYNSLVNSDSQLKLNHILKRKETIDIQIGSSFPSCTIL